MLRRDSSRIKSIKVGLAIYGWLSEDTHFTFCAVNCLLKLKTATKTYLVIQEY